MVRFTYGVTPHDVGLSLGFHCGHSHGTGATHPSKSWRGASGLLDDLTAGSSRFRTRAFRDPHVRVCDGAVGRRAPLRTVATKRSGTDRVTTDETHTSDHLRSS